jgi:serine/threonine-protein kinase Chk2
LKHPTLKTPNYQDTQLPGHPTPRTHYSHLHGRRIVHRDLKPGNILVMSRNPIHIKLGDFGESCNGRDEFVTFAGTLRYAAPEITKPPYTNKVDIRSFDIPHLV